MRSKLLNQSGVTRRLLILAVTLMAPLTALGLASTASAAPKGEFAVFADCPLSNAELSACLVARTESGEIKINKTVVPIVNTQTLQGGYIINRQTGATTFVGAADGNTLSKTAQKVPGGLLGIKCYEIKGEGKLEKEARKACEAIFEEGLLGVNATNELAAPASSIGLNEENILTETGTALTLPIKVKLENVFLGNNCYIGSEASPIVLHLTTGTTSPPPPNKPIKGKTGEITSRAEGAILVIKNNTLVDNSFAVPAATGCGGVFAFLIDPIIDAKLGLPSAAGNNTAILNSTLEQTGAEAAREHE